MNTTHASVVFKDQDRTIELDGVLYEPADEHELYLCVKKEYWDKHFKGKANHQVVTRYGYGNDPQVTYWTVDFSNFGTVDEDLVCDLFGDYIEFFDLEPDQQEALLEAALENGKWEWMRCLTITSDYSPRGTGEWIDDEVYPKFLGLDPAECAVGLQG